MSNLPLDLRRIRVEEATSMRHNAQKVLREATARKEGLSRKPFPYCIGYQLHHKVLTNADVSVAHEALATLYAQEEIDAAAAYVYWYTQEQELIKELELHAPGKP